MGRTYTIDFSGCSRDVLPGNKGTREIKVQGNKGTRKQGNKGTRKQGNKGTRE